MSSWDGRLTEYSRALAEQRALIETSRQERRQRYRAAVMANVFKWRLGIGHNAAPMMDEQIIVRGIGAALGGLMEWRVLTLSTPMFETLDAMGRAFHDIALALSRGGPEQYAPKPRGTVPHQIRIGGTS